MGHVKRYLFAAARQSEVVSSSSVLVEEVVISGNLGGRRVFKNSEGELIVQPADGNYTLLELVPEAEIPDYWRKVLAMNESVADDLAVVRGMGEITKLVNRNTLEELKSVIVNDEVATIKLFHPDDVNASEGRLEMEDSQTVYRCGKDDIELPQDPERYV